MGGTDSLWLDPFTLAVRHGFVIAGCLVSCSGLGGIGFEILIT